MKFLIFLCTLAVFCYADDSNEGVTIDIKDIQKTLDELIDTWNKTNPEEHTKTDVTTSWPGTGEITVTLEHNKKVITEYEFVAYVHGNLITRGLVFHKTKTLVYTPDGAHIFHYEVTNPVTGRTYNKIPPLMGLKAVTFKPKWE